ncbi:hypothetical protein BDF20DRAFT_412571 [Mycotypha africana]|uniref:uncharacterized protein n=1 Tax=Mycotypha africana TaxID=64632 RepID=UPI0023004498|nr:uncharacterized protein BDF20DRAFT_412571 [Mycotypha africana]KAI8981613.1 hypothetical protein BDF20DRAFT_412571 [Mycotypha africana]
MASTHHYEALHFAPSYAFPPANSTVLDANTDYQKYDSTDQNVPQENNANCGSAEVTTDKVYEEQQVQQLRQEIVRLRSEEQRLKMKVKIVKSDIDSVKEKLQKAHK